MGQKLRAMQGMDQRDQAELTQFGQQLQQAQSAQQVMSQLNNMCFKKCVDKPSASLSSYEKDCIQNCAMRFMDVQKQIVERFPAERLSSDAWTVKGFFFALMLNDPDTQAICIGVRGSVASKGAWVSQPYITGK